MTVLIAKTYFLVYLCTIHVRTIGLELFIKLTYTPAYTFQFIDLLGGRIGLMSVLKEN